MKSGNKESREQIVYSGRENDGLYGAEPDDLLNPGNEFPFERKGPGSAEAALERHYTVKEIADMWQLDEKMIRRIFGDEPGVVSIGSNESRFRRAYRTLRIPQSVLVRVHRRLRKAG